MQLSFLLDELFLLYEPSNYDIFSIKESIVSGEKADIWKVDRRIKWGSKKVKEEGIGGHRNRRNKGFVFMFSQNLELVLSR